MKNRQRLLFDIDGQTSPTQSKDTFDNGLLLVKSYLLTHGYTDTLARLDGDFRQDDILKSPENKLKFPQRFFSRRAKRRKTSEDKKPHKRDNVWSVEERVQLRRLLIERRDFKAVRRMLLERSEFNEILEMNVNLRIFLQEFAGLEDENEKIMRLEREKELFTVYRDWNVIGCRSLKSKGRGRGRE